MELPPEIYISTSMVRMYQVATVVMETTQLVLRQFINFLLYQLRIEQALSVLKMISKCCELVKLCHINRSGPVFLRHSVDNKMLKVYEGPFLHLQNCIHLFNHSHCHVVCFGTDLPWRYINIFCAPLRV